MSCVLTDLNLAFRWFRYFNSPPPQQDYKVKVITDMGQYLIYGVYNTSPPPPPNRQKYTCSLLVHSGVLVFLRVRKQSITAILHVRMSVLSVLPHLKGWAFYF